MVIPIQKMAPNFDQRANRYEQHAQVQSEAADWLAQWLPEHASASRCLELGAGTGLFTRHLVGRFDHLESTDISANMLRICRARFPEVNFRIRDAWKPSKQPEDWDFLVSSSLLQWAPCPDTVMRQWASFVQPKGRLILGFFVHPSLPEMMEIMDEKGPVTWHSSDMWSRIFSGNGFHLIRIETKNRRYHYETALHFWQSLHGTGATISRKMSPGALRRLLRNYDARFRQGDGVYASWTFCRVELERISTSTLDPSR